MAVKLAKLARIQKVGVTRFMIALIGLELAEIVNTSRVFVVLRSQGSRPFGVKITEVKVPPL